MNEPDPLVIAYLKAKQRAESAQADLEELRDRLVKQMEADQRKSFRWNADGVIHKVTFVQQHTTHVDEPGLRKALTAKVFDRYTKRVLDRKSMELAMDSGEVDPVTVSRFVTQVPKKAFLTYTNKETE